MPHCVILIHRQAGELELERYVRQHSAGIRSNGNEKVLAGETSLDEVPAGNHGGVMALFYYQALERNGRKTKGYD